MRVALDYDAAIRGRSGVSRYVRALTAHLLRSSDDLHLYLLASSSAGVPQHPRATPVVHGMPQRLWRAKLLASLILGFPIGRSVPEVDIFHATDYAFPPEGGPIGKVVVTVHDLAVLTAPQTVTPLNWVSLRLFLWQLQRCRYPVIVPSAAIAAEMVRRLDYPRERVTVIPMAADFGDDLAASMQHVSVISPLSPRCQTGVSKC